MEKGKMIEIPREPGRIFLQRNVDVGHITGTPPPDPPPDHKGVSFWPR